MLDARLHDPDGGRKKHQLFSVFFLVWLLVAAAACVVLFFPQLLGIPETSVKPAYHGALFLGASAIGAVVVWFALVALIRLQESTTMMERRYYETERLAAELDSQFAQLEHEFGPFPSDQPKHPDDSLSAHAHRD